jgi:exodeoxyribonuclease VII large subunit
LLDIAGDLIWITFPRDETLRTVVRALPERRFDSRAGAWTVPTAHLATVVARLEDHHFKFTPAMREAWEAFETNERDESADGLTVLQVNERVRQVIEGEFREPFWVVGELQSFDRNSKSGNAYFELVERPRPNVDPVAEVNCICFRSTRVEIYHKLKSLPDIAFRDGLKVRLLVRPTVYARKGRFQLVMEDLDPYFTAGELQRRRDAVIAAMKQLGIAEQNLRKPMPLVPLRVALVTSASGDARRDFESELAASSYRFRVEVFEAAMQGTRTEQTVLAALRAVSTRAGEFDVVCLVRGGGARSDLSFFDTEAIGRAACELPLKLVVGVGHERDRCALDSLATSTKTPTAAAALLVSRVRDFHDRVLGCADRLERGVDAAIDGARRQWRESAYRVGTAAPRRLSVSRRRLERTSAELVDAGRLTLRRGAERLAMSEQRLSQRAHGRLHDAERDVEEATARLSLERLQRRLGARALELDVATERLERGAGNVLRDRERSVRAIERAVRLVHPDRVVQRGYALVRVDGQLVTRAEQLKQGVRATLTFRDGHATMTTDEVELHERDD